jgi:serine/threonine protein kinase
LTAAEVAARICQTYHYGLIDVAGEGTFKSTFHVTRGGSSFALKVLKEAPTDRSSREIDAMMRCDHPNVAKLIAVNSIAIDGARYAYIMEEYFRGGTLTERVGRLNAVEIAQLAFTLANALNHIATNHLVHRDLKPDNIMFRDDSNSLPVIVDFGLVRDLSATSLTATWAMRGPGTPFFAAPEQLNNDKELIKPWTDQFGLGTTLAFAWSKQHPYARLGDTVPVIVQRVAEWQLPSPAFVEACHAQQLGPLARMVRPYPVERFRTSRDVVDAWNSVVNA